MLEQPAWEIKRTIYTRAEEDFSTSLGLPPEERNLQQMLKRGVVVVDKVPGPTSHEVVAWVKKLMELDHVGHGGPTLLASSHGRAERIGSGPNASAAVALGCCFFAVR